jgi:hypothetical protein
MLLAAIGCADATVTLPCAAECNGNGNKLVSIEESSCPLKGISRLRCLRYATCVLRLRDL